MRKIRWLNIEDLYLLVYLSEGMSITEISKLMHVSQPAISQRLLKISNGLDCKVHKKTGRTILITEKGKLLAEAAKICVEILEKAID